MAKIELFSHADYNPNSYVYAKLLQISAPNVWVVIGNDRQSEVLDFENRDILLFL